jgi:hypothetical protein
MMQIQAKPIHARLRFAGVFIILGLMVQAVSLLWNHPLFQVIGIALYLLTVVNMAGSPADGADAQPRPAPLNFPTQT